MMVVVKRSLLDGGLVADTNGGGCEIIAVADDVVAIVAAATLRSLGVLLLRAEVRVFELLSGLQGLSVHPCLDDR